MKKNRGFSDLVSYVDIDLKDKLTQEEREEIYHLLLLACTSARDSGVANCEADNELVSLKKDEKWVDKVKQYWSKK